MIDKDIRKGMAFGCALAGCIIFFPPFNIAIEAKLTCAVLQGVILAGLYLMAELGNK